MFGKRIPDFKTKNVSLFVTSRQSYYNKQSILMHKSTVIRSQHWHYNEMFSNKFGDEKKYIHFSSESIGSYWEKKVKKYLFFERKT